jgi:hypothetical protein
MGQEVTIRFTRSTTELRRVCLGDRIRTYNHVVMSDNKSLSDLILAKIENRKALIVSCKQRWQKLWDLNSKKMGQGVIIHVEVTRSTS